MVIDDVSDGDPRQVPCSQTWTIKLFLMILSPFADSDPAALYSSMRRRTDVPEAGTDPGSGNSSVRRHSDVMYGTVSIRMKSRREHPAEPESDVVYSLLKATVAPPHESDPPCC
ncbi:hypothetical protein GOODEAATRI_018307 [Goodea atripinnis]|uniref:Uncharacterized protein n=1 Tax=Goodea atripinnis TaxID=208336 RepID=A0ABV0NVN4_9TELE